MAYPITNDSELLQHLADRAQQSGLDGMEINIFSHFRGNDSPRSVTFHIGLGYSSVYGSIDGEGGNTIDEAIGKLRTKVREKSREIARKLRKEAEEKMAQADKIDPSEPTYPPEAVLAAERAQAKS